MPGANASSWEEEFYAAHMAENRHDLVKAERLYLNSLKNAEARETGNVTKELITIGALVDLYTKKRDWSKAESYSLRQLKMAEEMGFCDDDKFHALTCLAYIARVRDQVEKCELFSIKALPIAESKYGTSSEVVAQLLGNIYISCRRQYKYPESIPAAQRALKIHEKLKPNGIEVSNDLEWLASVYSDTRHLPQGERCALQCLAIRQKICKPDDRSMLDGMQVLAVIYGQEHKLESALPIFKHIQKMAPSVYGPNTFQRCMSLMCFGNAYFENGRYKDAALLYQQALAIEKKYLPSDPLHTEAVNKIADCYLKVGDKASAQRVCQDYLKKPPALTQPSEAVNQVRNKLAECQ